MISRALTCKDIMSLPKIGQSGEEHTVRVEVNVLGLPGIVALPIVKVKGDEFCLKDQSLRHYFFVHYRLDDAKKMLCNAKSVVGVHCFRGRIRRKW